MDLTSKEYRVRQCSKCPGDFNFHCTSCQSELCANCKQNHNLDFNTVDHNAVIHREHFNFIQTQDKCARHPRNDCSRHCESCDVSVYLQCTDYEHHKMINVRAAYQTLRQQRSGTIHIIRSETLFNRCVYLDVIKECVQKIHTYKSICLSNMLSKALKLTKRLANVSDDVDYKHRCSKQKTKFNRYIARILIYEHIYEQSAMKPVTFLLNTKRRLTKIQNIPSHETHASLSMTESLSEHDVKQVMDHKTKKNKGRVGNERLLKLVLPPRLHQSLSITELVRCGHITCATPDRIWTSYEGKLSLMNTIGDTLYYLEDIYFGIFENGVHTMTSDGELIYIDMETNIKKLSKEMENTITYIPCTTSHWIPECVYCSSCNGDLLVGMHSVEIFTGKVMRYNSSGKLKQTIQHDNKGVAIYQYPSFITENNNGDIIVSDPLPESGAAVIVTNRYGRHRFFYKGPSTRLGLEPRGICTDPLSHILVCDEKTNTVHMLDQDGQFMSYLLIRPSGVFKPHSLSYDIHRHCLWVASSFNNKVCVFRYINRRKIPTGEFLYMYLPLTNLEKKGSNFKIHTLVRY